MFTRIVEVTTKKGKDREFINALNDKVMAILKKEAGFVDEITLSSESQPERIVALSFWNSKEDADRYNQAHFATVKELIQPFLESGPDVKTYNVSTSTNSKISARA